MKTLKLLTLLTLIFSCTTQEEEATTSTFDPRVPGSPSTASVKIHDVSGLEITTATHESVTLNWYNPPLYEGLDYSIYVYRIDGDGEEGSFQLPDPSDPVSGAFLYYPRLDYEPSEITTYVDNNSANGAALRPGDEFSYIVVVEKDGYFSPGKKVTLTISSQDELITIPAAGNFWDNFLSRQGSAPDPVSGDIFHDTLFVDNADPTQAGGNMVYAQNDMVAFFADTANNRVIMYKNVQGLECYNSFTEGSVEFDACIAINASAPLQVFAVLGQESFQTNYTCADVANPLGPERCMTAPKGVLVENDKLYVSTGDDRVVIFDSLPEWGCYNIRNMFGESTPSNCSFDRVIGKQDVSDLATYTLLADGDAALSCPSGMVFIDDNLYIADTCNNRVVRVADAGNATLNNCTAANWKTGRCSFDRVLGQEDMFSNNSLLAEYDAGNFAYDEIADEITGDTSLTRRYFANPTRLKTDGNALLVMANENFSRSVVFGDLQLYSRIMIFNTSPIEGTFPACTNLTFNSGGCDATFVIGQRDWDKMSVIPSGMNYQDNNYAIKWASGMETYGTYLFVTDYETNEVIVYEDYSSATNGQLPSVRAPNPNGVFDSTRNRALPNLGGLTDVKYIESTGNMVFFDGNGSSLIQINIVDFSY